MMYVVFRRAADQPLEAIKVSNKLTLPDIDFVLRFFEPHRLRLDWYGVKATSAEAAIEKVRAGKCEYYDPEIDKISPP